MFPELFFPELFFPELYFPDFGEAGETPLVDESVQRISVNQQPGGSAYPFVLYRPPAEP